MAEFHPFTLSATREILLRIFQTHKDLDALIYEWECNDLVGGGSLGDKLLDLIHAASEDDAPEVRTIRGDIPLARALVETALEVPQRYHKSGSWKKLKAGLRMDGFEIMEIEEPPVPDEAIDGLEELFGKPRGKIRFELCRMLPEDAPELDFREAESELSGLLHKHGFDVASGHLKQAISAFSRGDWAASNSQLRSFFESLLSDISDSLGGKSEVNNAQKRKYLSESKSGPFFLAVYNEWEDNQGKRAFVPGLWARLHPEGSHPGLSEEEDATFRLQVVLITARLFMRCFDRTKNPNE